MKTLNYKTEGILWIFLMLPALYLAYVWSELPNVVPIHFDASGEPNGWGGKETEFILIAVNIFVYIFMLSLDKVDPKNLTEGFFTSNYFKLRAALVVFLSILTGMVIHAALPGQEHAGLHLIPALVFLMLSVLGNFMINLKPNWFIGIRTPWTLSSDVVWRKTHQFGGRVWFYGGLICVALTFLLKGALLQGLILTFIFGSVVLFFAYSFWLFKQEQKNAAE